ncbi:alpha/beta hydrolase [Kribbella sp. NBC_00709]|uniref:dienelactone hydrolase family protein n=1 Tax=Kribbella sp. NBC_00709 TaxID=2975972 RepID=UPI002E28BA13|nr:alpha/beta hydrolase [Kribbella sp. NBC_00709]
MDQLRFISTTTTNGVLEREFSLGDVHGMLWSPASAEPAPLVLLGHGGGRDSKAAPMVGRARMLTEAGFHAVSIDAPGHGDRPRTALDERETVAMQHAMEVGEPVGPIVVPYNLHLAERAVPEWQATLDALEQLPEISGPFGYFGLNMGTAIGVPLTAVDGRITAAVFGIFWYDETLAEHARRIKVPVEFAVQWDDQHIPRESAMALFDAFASTEKSLHANAGAHKEVPRFEVDSMVRFFTRHLR